MEKLQVIFQCFCPKIACFVCDRINLKNNTNFNLLSSFCLFHSSCRTRKLFEADIHLPSYPQFWELITVRHPLAHTHLIWDAPYDLCWIPVFLGTSKALGEPDAFVQDRGFREFRCAAITKRNCRNHDIFWQAENCTVDSWFILFQLFINFILPNSNEVIFCLTCDHNSF